MTDDHRVARLCLSSRFGGIAKSVRNAVVLNIWFEGQQSICLQGMAVS